MSDFGAKLRDARERRGISLREIETRTKVSVAALESLERNDVTRLPGGIFARALVREYASEVGLDPDATMHEFIVRFNLEPPSTVAAASGARDAVHVDAVRHRAAVLVTILLAGLVAAAILFLLTLSRAPEGQSNGPALDNRPPPADHRADGVAPRRGAAKPPLS
jgi:cytoskeletal protein RodZ